MKLRHDPAASRQFCETHEVARLEFFGPELRDDFRADSDVDVLCTLQPDSGCTLLVWADRRFKLEVIFGRPVDLVSRPASSAAGIPFGTRPSSPRPPPSMSREAFLANEAKYNKAVNCRRVVSE